MFKSQLLLALCITLLALPPTLIRLEPTSKWNENGERNFTRAWEWVLENTFGWWNPKPHPSPSPILDLPTNIVNLES